MKLLVMSVLATMAVLTSEMASAQIIGGRCNAKDPHCNSFQPGRPDFDRPGFGGPDFNRPGRPMPPRPPRPGPGPGYPPPPPPPPPVYSDSEEIYMGRMLQNETLDMSRMLSYRAQGRQIESVIVWARTPAPAVLSLRNNGWEEDSVRADYPGAALQLRVRSSMIVGRDRAELFVNGRIQIDRITVQFSRGGYPPPPNGPNSIVIPVVVNQSVYTGSVINVEHYVNLAAYRGYRLESLMLEARNMDRGATRADVLMNGMNVGNVILDGFGRGPDLYINQWLGGNDRIELRFAGNAIVDRVVLKLSR